MYTYQDLEIKFNEDLTFSNYERLNPQTEAFIKKFGLDDRLF